MNDRRGNPVGTRSNAALDAAEQALWRMMSFYGTPLDDLDAAAAADPAWSLPVLMKAGFLLSLTEPSVLADARVLLAEAEAHRPSMTERERGHLHALKALQAGDWPGACDTWEDLLRHHPRDALALQWAHLFDFHRGDARNLCQRVARVLPAWADDDALYPYVLGQHAFGLEENHCYAEAEAVGRQALAGSAKVPWAIHAVAHVMEMQGRHLEGSAWMATWHADWATGNGFAGHLGWHHALFAIERLDRSEALRLFDAHLAADPAQITLQRLDAAALLWRMQLLGWDVGGRWRQLVAGWPLTVDAAGCYPFNDLHALLALIGRGDIAGAERWIGWVAAQSERSGGHPRTVAREIALPLMRGLLAFGQGRFDDAVQELTAVKSMTVPGLGGSHAQRDLIAQTVLAAAAGAADPSAGLALLDERGLTRPPSPWSAHWRARLGPGRQPPVWPVSAAAR